MGQWPGGKRERGDVLICLARIGPAAQKAILPIRELLKVKAHPPKPLLIPHGLDIRLGAACVLLHIVPGDEQALLIVKAGLRASDKDLRLLALEARQAGLALLVVYLIDLLGTDEEVLVLERWALRQLSKVSC